MDEDAVAMNLCFLLALIVASRGTPAVGQALASALRSRADPRRVMLTFPRRLRLLGTQEATALPPPARSFAGGQGAPASSESGSQPPPNGHSVAWMLWPQVSSLLTPRRKWEIINSDGEAGPVSSISR